MDISRGAFPAKKAVVAIEGLVGAGKSYLIENLALPVQKELEPVDLFSYFEFDQERFDPLKLFYESGGEKNQVVTQLHIIDVIVDWYCNRIQWNQGNETVIIERGFDSPAYFIETMFSAGNITKFEKHYLLKYLTGASWNISFNLWAKAHIMPVTHIIVLDTPIPLCLDHIKKRRRDSEMVTPEMESYLKCMEGPLMDHVAKYKAIIGPENVYSLRFHPNIAKDVEQIIKFI